MAGRSYRGLIVDFGGVLTTNIWTSFDLFCDSEGLERGAVLGLFREDGEALALLRSLERGAVTDAEFERDFGELLGVAPEGLIERLFAGLSPEQAMIDAVSAARAAGHQDRPDHQLLGHAGSTSGHRCRSSTGP